MDSTLQASDLVGTWRLCSFEIRYEDGERALPFGEAPVGYLTYTADGYMSAQLAAASRPRFARSDGLTATPEEGASAVRTCIAYAGRFSVAGDRVRHHAEVSLVPNWVGGTLERIVHLQGDHLTLATDRRRFGGRAGVATLLWERC